MHKPEEKHPDRHPATQPRHADHKQPRPAEEHRSPDQQAAILEVEVRSKEANKLARERVTSLVAVIALGIAAGLYGLMNSFGVDGTGIFGALASLAVIAMSVYLIEARDLGVAKLVVKAFAILQIISTLANLMAGNGLGFYLNGIVFIFLVYAFMRLNTLRYF